MINGDLLYSERKHLGSMLEGTYNHVLSFVDSPLCRIYTPAKTLTILF